MENILESLKLSYGKFLCLCIMAGCDYLPNVPGIGIHREKQMIDHSDDFQSVLEKYPAKYQQKFQEAKLVFLHQTVIDPTSRKSVPLFAWEDITMHDKHQFNCGKYPLEVV